MCASSSCSITVAGRMPQRPDPPSHLSPDEAQVWHGAVRSMRRDWSITEPVQALLRAYCVQCVLADELAARLRALRGKGKRDEAYYRALVAAHTEACKTLLKLATALRLTPSSNRQSIRDARVSLPQRWPWERA